jgi:hypothetical protein
MNIFGVPKYIVNNWSLMITGDSESLCKKAYLRPGGKGLSSMGGLEGSSVSSRGSDSVGFFLPPR